MKRRLLDFIWCPKCKGDLTPSATAERDGVILEGSLRCTNGHVYPILEGIPRFIDAIASSDDLRKVYADSFGHQWTTYDWLRDCDADEFYAITDWKPETFHGKTVLDAGCGGGRVARFIARESGEFLDSITRSPSTRPVRSPTFPTRTSFSAT